MSFSQNLGALRHFTRAHREYYSSNVSIGTPQAGVPILSIQDLFLEATDRLSVRPIVAGSGIDIAIEAEVEVVCISAIRRSN